MSAKSITSQPEKRRSVDWDAVERDFRTGKFTLRELAVAHHVSHQAIGKKAEKMAWTQDLAKAIKQATNAILIQEIINNQVAKDCQSVASTILVAAELNKQVIIGHRHRLAELKEDVVTAKLKLMDMGETVADIREAAIFVQAVGSLITATKTLICEERKAFSLDDEDQPMNEDKVAKFITSLGKSSLPVVLEPIE